MGFKNSSTVLLGLLITLVANSLQSSVFSLQPAINDLEEQDAKLLLERDLENFEELANEKLSAAQKHQLAELAENFLSFIESDQTNQENRKYYKQLRNLFANQQNDDYQQSDEIDERKRAPLLPWLPAKKREYMTKRALRPVQSKKVSHDLEGIYGKNHQMHKKRSGNENANPENKEAEDKKEKKRDTKQPWFKFGLDKKSVKDDVYDYLDSSRKLRIYDLEKIQEAIERLKQSSDY